MSIQKKDTRGRWAVNGTPIYVPTSVQIEHTNVAAEDSGRTEDGVMHITWVRRDVVKVHLKYSALTGAECDFMRSLMQGKEYTFTYYDNGVHTINAYTGDNDYTIYSTNDKIYGTEGGLYQDMSIDAVEL